MRKPTSWGDRGLLADEPFQTDFAVLEASYGSRQASLQTVGRLKSIAETLREDKDSSEAVSVWLEFAFVQLGPNDPNKLPLDVIECYKTFVEFYWLLFREPIPVRNGAELFLQSKRKSLGYTHNLPKQCTSACVDLVSKRCPMPSQDNSHKLGSKVNLVKTSHYTLGGLWPRNTLSEGGKSRRLKHRSIVHSREHSPNAPPATHAIVRSGKIQETSPNTNETMKETLALSPTSNRFCPLESMDVDPMEMSVGGLVKKLKRRKNQFYRSDSSITTTEGPRKKKIKDETSIQLPAQADPASIAPTINTPSTLEIITRNKPIHNIPGVAKPLPPMTLIDRSAEWLQSVASKVNKGPGATDSLPVARYQTQPSGIKTQYKPPLPSLPPIWAQSRQEVCESFDWFRSYQGGVYFTQGIVKGYLLSAFPSCRDAFEHGGKLIISHGGGKAESIHSHQGQTTVQSADDQCAQDKSVRALINNHKEARPLVLLIDDRYSLFPYDLGAKNITYAALGFYTITHFWAEYQPASNQEGRVVRYKFVFEWCEGQGEPWWIREPEIEDAQRMAAQPFTSSPERRLLIDRQSPKKTGECKFTEFEPSKPESRYISCMECNEKTPHVYQGGWFCLNPLCSKFWTTASGREPGLPLLYNPEFLHLSTPLVLPFNLTDIRPEPPISAPTNGNTTTYTFTRGWHCRLCGRLSCRFKWEHWECSNPDCKNIVKITGRLHDPSEFWLKNSPSPSFRDHKITESSGIVQERMITFRYGSWIGQRQTFILPDGKGKIHHIQPSPRGTKEADMIFKEYQEQAASGELAFRRWPMRSHKCRGPLLTNYFSQNAGQPYQYVGGTANTVPFSEAPSAIIKARDLIEKRVAEALDANADFNEVLSAAYMDRQKMAFHSDSEPGLGPLVAGLSLGASALIHFRPRCRNQANGNHRTIAISFALRHGDILVMDGIGVQENYEHTVVPTGFRIAATARTIHL